MTEAGGALRSNGSQKSVGLAMGGTPKCTPSDWSDVKSGSVRGACGYAEPGEYPTLQECGGNRNCCRPNPVWLPQSDGGAPYTLSVPRRKKRKYLPMVPTIYEDKSLNIFLAPAEALQEPRPAKPSNTLNALGSARPGFRLVEAVVDSGASKSTGPMKLFPKRKLRPSLMSKRGLKFSGPDGTEIPNYGELQVDWEPAEGHKCDVVLQMSDVDRILLAVTELNDAGNDVVLKKAGGEIVNVKSGKRIALQRRGGVYTVRMWIPCHEGEASDFPRPGN